MSSEVRTHKTWEGSKFELSHGPNGVLLKVTDSTSTVSSVLTAQEAAELADHLSVAADSVVELNRNPSIGIKADLKEIKALVKYLRGIRTPAFPTVVVRLESHINDLETKLTRLESK